MHWFKCLRGDVHKVNATVAIDPTLIHTANYNENSRLHPVCIEHAAFVPFIMKSEAMS